MRIRPSNATATERKHMDTPRSKPLTKHKRDRAFTLIELSIVLVIIGLIVGGVLVGRDLIESSKVRAQATQLQKYSAAVNTFRAKFDGFPGDMRDEDSRRFGLLTATFDASSSTPAGTYGNPNSNGIIDSTWAAQYPLYMESSEQKLFWPNLGKAGFIENYSCFHYCYPEITPYTYIPPRLQYPNIVGKNFPAMKLNETLGIIPAMIPTLGSHYWALGIKSYQYTLEDSSVQTPSLHPSQAMKLDQKMDDGMPNGGSVRILKFPGGPHPVSGLYYTGYNVANDDNIAQGAYTPANCVSNGGGHLQHYEYRCSVPHVRQNELIG